MPDPVIRFDDGAGYEKFMGIWSRMAGDVFIDWLRPAKGLKWVDVGCGNGAFTENIVDRCQPAEVQGIDPSEGQLAFARQRLAGKLAKFQQGDAMALPFADKSFDIAVMALVIFFVAEPANGGFVARQRPIGVGPLVGNDYVVESGLKAGDRLIVGGTQRIGDGAPVTEAPKK